LHIIEKTVAIQPRLCDTVGPMVNFAGLHPVSKMVLMLAMWIGRLEVLTVLVFFRFEVWRTARWTVA
jgi:Trk-type K+ transport system membrane component